MGFWGIEVKPGKPFEYHSDNGGKINVTQATLGTGSSTKKSILQCAVQDKSPVFLCSLLPDKMESCPLNLEFEDEDVVTFSVVGPRSIHLSGIFLAEDGDCHECDSFGEDIAETETDESTEYDSEDGYEDNFIDDSDLEMFPPSPVPNSGVVIEEIVDDEKPTNGNAQLKRIKKKNQVNESEGTKKSEQIVVKGDTGVHGLESEDEDGFPLSGSHESKPTVQNPEAEAKQTDKITAEKAKRKKAKDRGDDTTSLKRKVENIDQDGLPEMQKKNKKNKKQKEQNEEGKLHEAGIEDVNKPEVKSNNLNQVLPDGNEADQSENANGSKDKKKKKKKKAKTQESGEGTKVGQAVKATEGKGSSVLEVEKQTESKSSQVRTFRNGLVVEELAMGKPDGKKASPGKQVSVRYIGKLKKNDKIFDSNVGRAPFKFRLGVGQVIKGWDVGVNGMRVGDKRRLTIPPAMGYGAKGAGGQIPPNAWLMFDIELIDVR